MLKIILATVVVLAVTLFIFASMIRKRNFSKTTKAMLQVIVERLRELGDIFVHAQAKLERELRSQLLESSSVSRADAGAGVTQLQQVLSAQLISIATVQNNQIDSFAQQLSKLTQSNAQQLDAFRLSGQQQAQYAREEQAIALKRFSDTLNQQLAVLSESNERRLSEVRATLEKKLKDIEANNSTKLDEMRRVVDEKLHATLEQRLGESFRMVSDRLEQVHRGLGEMQTLAAGVGDLKKVLTNVKTRGNWGEVQLQALLEQMLTIDQYAKNVATVPHSNERVEFAIRLPGRNESEKYNAQPVWLPIDAKFPREDYERLIEAQDRADSIGLEDAFRALETRVKLEAKAITDKYVSPPYTTDFALLFLPTEGLYAEILRRPGLTDTLQRDYRVMIAGPTTLAALLNSLQMGFRTLAIEKRSSEVWQVLGAVKTEFGKFGDVLTKTKNQLATVAKSIELAETRTRQMNRKLRDVEALPGEKVAELLEDDEKTPKMLQSGIDDSV
ncbi:DNA recombination protein RmuC [Candidatus Vallotia lariciata]|uniref:DNA recombination protein RmuC n=1 Tax=Candidatus Vallotia laricis TaxID=2018052 RepID=UPI001D032A73|nr:DNA recombination protein RmuC [Candidatus Vallotia lariciata]UDG83196.1 DNA recombination protein RmuC [Candidatus Vallotia lariciata]